MSIPLSIVRKLESARDEISRAERISKTDRDLTKLESAVADCLVKLHLALDRTQNKTWEKFNSKDADSGKPNIYFPLAESRQKFDERLKKDQLHELIEKCPEIYSILLSAQPFSGASWWTRMYGLSRQRHERDPKLSAKVRLSTAIGNGQNLYIDSMVLGPTGIVEFKGNSWSQSTGRAEPVRIDLSISESILIAELGIDALQFAKQCLSETTNLTRAVFAQH